MRVVAAVLVTLLVLGCKVEQQKTSRIDTDPGFSDIQCPTLPPNYGVTISGEKGPDFWTCLAKSDRTGKALFNIYIGNFPDAPQDLKFAGTTATTHGNLVWFRPRSNNKPWEEKQWITFVPTGDSRMSVMMVSFYAKPEDLEAIAESVAQMKQ